jgi:hypothetical protein
MYMEKRRVDVRVSQSGHDPLDGFFCLALAGGPHEAPQTVLGLLNSPLRVIPFIVEGDGSVILVTRQNVDWVMTPEHVESGLVYPSGYVVTREEPAELEFMNGTTMDGLIQMAGQGAGRASDFLNGRDDFYPVLTRHGILLVNKSRVRETRLSTVIPNWAPKSQAA